MSQKPESSFISKIHKALHPSVYREKQHNTYRGGTPDVYYEGNADALWIEYKWLNTLPKKLVLNLSGLQLRWLQRCANNNKQPWVILGWKEGKQTYCVRFMKASSWDQTHFKKELEAQKKTVEDVANLIKWRCIT